MLTIPGISYLEVFEHIAGDDRFSADERRAAVVIAEDFAVCDARCRIETLIRDQCRERHGLGAEAIERCLVEEMGCRPQCRFTSRHAPDGRNIEVPSLSVGFSVRPYTTGPTMNVGTYALAVCDGELVS